MGNMLIITGGVIVLVKNGMAYINAEMKYIMLFTNILILVI